jgi:bifunctional lysine-specific demethylase and histidyl-hydroxylase NO66
LHLLENEAHLREALPVGFAREPPEVLASLLAERLTFAAQRLAAADAATVAEQAVRRFWRSRPPVLAGQLHQLQRLPLLGDDSWVRRRSGVVAHLAQDGDRLHLVLGDRRLEMPAFLAPAVRRLVDAVDAPILVEALADLIDAAGRRVLVGRLIREGLLEMVDG